MVGQEILVLKDNTLRPLTEMWFRNSANLLARASGAYVSVWSDPARRETAKLVPMFEGLAAPANLKGSAPDATSVTLKWDAVTGAVKYQILRRDGAVQGSAPYSTVKELVPTSGSAWTNRTWKVTGTFAKDTSYVFSVRAVNAAGQIGPETNPAVKYYSGRAKVQKTGTKSRTFSPKECGNWDKEMNWDRHPGQPGEGYPMENGTAERNKWGCIDYSNVYAEIARLDGADIADHIALGTTANNVTSASIKDMARTDDGGNDAPELNLHPGTFAIGVLAAPTWYKGTSIDTKEVVAPKPGKAKGAKTDIADGWGRLFAKKPPHDGNGLILYRADGAGRVIMHGINANFLDNWKLTLGYKWDFTSVTYKAPAQEPWTFTG